MNQTIWEAEDVVQEMRRSGLLTSLCTISRSPEVSNDAGAPYPLAPYEQLDGHVDIECIKASLADSEEKATPEVLTRNLWQTILAGYFPEITTRDRATVDGITYDIVGVDADSQRVMTRLTLQRSQV